MKRIVPQNILNSSNTVTLACHKTIMTISQPPIKHPFSGTARVRLSSLSFSMLFMQILMRRIRKAWFRKQASIIIAELHGGNSALRFLKRLSSAKDMHISIVKSLRTVCWWLGRKSRALLSKFSNQIPPNLWNRSFQHCGVFCILNVGVSGLIQDT